MCLKWELAWTERERKWECERVNRKIKIGFNGLRPFKSSNTHQCACVCVCECVPDNLFRAMPRTTVVILRGIAWICHAIYILHIPSIFPPDKQLAHAKLSSPFTFVVVIRVAAQFCGSFNNAASYLPASTLMGGQVVNLAKWPFNLRPLALANALSHGPQR